MSHSTTTSIDRDEAQSSLLDRRDILKIGCTIAVGLSGIGSTGSASGEEQPEQDESITFGYGGIPLTISNEIDDSDSVEEEIRQNYGEYGYGGTFEN